MKPGFYVSVEKIWWHWCFFENKINHHFWTWSKKVSVFVETFLAGLSKLHYTCSKKLSEQSFLLRKLLFFIKIGTSIELFPHSWQFFPGFIVKTAWYVSVGKVWTKFSWIKIFFINYGHWAKNYPSLVKIFQIELANLPSRGQ